VTQPRKPSRTDTREQPCAGTSTCGRGKKNEIFCACILRDRGEGSDEKAVHPQHTKVVRDYERKRVTANGMQNR